MTQPLPLSFQIFSKKTRFDLSSALRSARAGAEGVCINLKSVSGRTPRGLWNLWIS